jgi:hypothetical protein
MNTRQKIYIAAASVIVVNAYLNFRHVRKTEEAKREEIRQHAMTELATLAIAEARMIERITSGNYDGNVSMLMDDLDFEHIRAHYE